MSQPTPCLQLSASGCRDAGRFGAAWAKPLGVWMPVLVGAVAMGIYANSLPNDFAYDDIAIVKESAHVVHLEWTAIWTDNYWPHVSGMLPDVLYRPLTLWTYLANQSLTPGVPWPFHLVNIVLHGLVSMLVCTLAWRVFGNRWVALLAGVLFAVHPIHTEVVANIVGRAELLAALWSLLAMLVFLPSTPLMLNSTPVTRPWWHGLLVATCFLAAIFSKETPVTLLLAIPLLDAWRWWRWNEESHPTWVRWFAGQAVRYYLPMVVALGVYLKLRIAACGLMSDTKHVHPVVNALTEASPLERIITPFMLLAKYLWIMFWPSHLSADYSAPSLMPTANPFFASDFQPPAAAGMLILGLALILALKYRRKAPAFVLLLGLFGASYLLVANFLRIGTIFGERLFYWPSAFLLILVVWGLFLGYQKLGAARPFMARRAAMVAVLALMAAPVSVMGYLTCRRNSDWADNITLAISTARDNPNSAKAVCWAGATLAMADRPEYVTIGKTLLDRAVELAPNFSLSRWELAKYYGMRHDMAQSAICIAEAERLDSGSRLSCLAAPALLVEMRGQAPDSFMPAIEAYAREHPDRPAAQLALAYGWHAQGEYDKAAECTRNAIEMDNQQRAAKHARQDGYEQFHEAGAELARIWFDRGWLEQAADKYRLYVAFMNRSPDARCVLVKMLLAMDPKTHPYLLDEVRMNLAFVEKVDPDNPKIRELRGKLQQADRQLAQGGVVTANADDGGKTGDFGAGGGP